MTDPNIRSLYLKECPDCDGKGEVLVIDRRGSITPEDMPCSTCGGHGYVRADDQTDSDDSTSEMAKAQKRIAELEAEVKRLRKDAK